MKSVQRVEACRPWYLLHRPPLRERTKRGGASSEAPDTLEDDVTHS